MLYLIFFFFFFNDTATTEIYTLSLHDALPICPGLDAAAQYRASKRERGRSDPRRPADRVGQPLSHLRHGERSEEHTSELQSQSNLVCRLLLEKKKKITQRA